MEEVVLFVFIQIVVILNTIYWVPKAINFIDNI
jgi:hypothetical protein